MESRRSNKESVIQSGGNEKASPFVIRDVFSSFSLLITGKEFQSKVFHKFLLHFLLLFIFMPLPSPLFQFTYWQRCFWGQRGSFLLAAHRHLLFFPHSGPFLQVRFGGASLHVRKAARGSASQGSDAQCKDGKKSGEIWKLQDLRTEREEHKGTRSHVVVKHVSPLSQLCGRSVRR